LPELLLEQILEHRSSFDEEIVPVGCGEIVGNYEVVG